MKLLRIAMLLVVSMNCVSKEVKVVDQAFEYSVQQKMDEMIKKEREANVQDEASSRLREKRSKGESKESYNQMSPQEIKVSFDLVRKNIDSEDERVVRAALDLFFRLYDSLNQQQIQLITSQLFDKKVLQDLVSDDSKKSNEARNLLDRIVLDLNEAQKKQLIDNLLQELVRQGDLEKTNYDKVANIFTYLFNLVKKDVLKSSFYLKTLFKQFKTLLFREIEQNKNNEQLVNLQAKVNLQQAGQYPNRKSSRLLGILESLLQKSLSGEVSWSIGLDLKNKEIFQLLFEIVQAVAEEPEAEIKARGLWMLGTMVK